MKMYLINFIKATCSMGDHGKSTQSITTSVLKCQLFSTGEESYKNKSFIFQFCAGVGVYVQILMLEPCMIAKLQIFGHSCLNIL